MQPYPFSPPSEKSGVIVESVGGIMVQRLANSKTSTNTRNFWNAVIINYETTACRNAKTCGGFVVILGV